MTVYGRSPHVRFFPEIRFEKAFQNMTDFAWDLLRPNAACDGMPTKHVP